MKRIVPTVILVLLAMLSLAHADETTREVQESLKEQGFYYGDVTGEKTADTTAAIRRYQIRNGLQITGEIDAETLRSLGIGSRQAESTPAPQASPTPTQETATESDEGQSAELSPGTASPSAAEQQQGAPRQQLSDIFANTPYEMAPPDLQRHVIVGAQTLLARRGYYESGIDGQFGPATEAAVRAFQQRIGLPPDGHLNMDTLSALGLLPGQHAPARPRPLRRAPPYPIYRGQWVPGP